MNENNSRRTSANRSRRARIQAQRRRRRRKQIRLLCFLCLLLLAVIGILFWQFRGSRTDSQENLTENQLSSDGADSIAESSPTPSPTPTPVPVSTSITGDDIASHYALLIRRDTGEKIFELRSEEKMYPASMTKMMTALVAYEQLTDLQAKITLNSEMFDPLYEEGASMAGFSPEEEVTGLDLLYGVLLPSGADCCIGLADYISGSEEAFAELMNQKAAQLGMTNTHFCNATGLHDENHYTTVSDLAKLLEAVLAEDTLREIITSANHTSEPTNLHPEGVTYTSSLFDYMPQEIRDSGLILGGKTGYTEEAGQCLASLGEVNGMEFLCITGLAPGNHETDPYHIIDAYRCYSSITAGGVSAGTSASPEEDSVEDSENLSESYSETDTEITDAQGASSAEDSYE